VVTSEKLEGNSTQYGTLWKVFVMGAKDLIKQKPKLEDLILSLDMLDDQSSVSQEE